jgi:hypothetical protein
MSDDGESGGDYDLEGYASDGSRDSDVDDNGNGNGFFDMEAAESGTDSDGSDSQDSANNSPSSLPLDNSESYYGGDPASFPQFMRLPIELRYHIWGLFCPDLTAKSRVFEFLVGGQTHSSRFSKQFFVLESPFLDQQTAATRAVLATHHESRALVLRKLPDALRFRGGECVVRFDKDNDVVFVNNLLDTFGGTGTLAFGNQVKYLALDSTLPRLGHQQPESLFLSTFPDLEAVYYLFAQSDPSDPWLKADKLNSYHFQTFEEEPGLGEDLDYVYCWPDASSNAVPIEEVEITRNFALDNSESGYDPDTVAGSEIESTGTQRIPILPMIRFEFDSGLEKFNRLMHWRRHGGELDWDSDTSSQSESQTDEYESEGIDDDEIDSESHRSSEEDDDLAVVPLADDGFDGGDADEHESADFSGFYDSSGDGADHEASHELPVSEYPVAAFSSPEPDPESSPLVLPGDSRALYSGSSPMLESGGGSSPEISSSEGSPVRIVSRPKRRLVSSDTEDDDDEGPSKKVGRPSKRIARVVVSDSEDSEDDKDDDG